SANPPVFSTYAGTDYTPGYQDGPALTAKFNEPYSIVMAPDGTMYVADFNNSAIRVISPDGRTVSTLLGKPVPPAPVVATNRDLYSSPSPVPFSTATIPYPQVIRFDSQGNLVMGESVTRVVRLINIQTKTVSRIHVIAPNTSPGHSWIWLDVDTKGTIGPKDDIIVAQSVGGSGNVDLWRYSHDGSFVAEFGGNGGPLQDGPAKTSVTARAGHYPWIIAISKTEGRFITSGFGTTGLSSWRILQPNDPPTTVDVARFVNGKHIWMSGTVPGFPWGSRPAFSSIGGATGVGHLGIIPTFDDIMDTYPTDSALAAYIQSGFGGSVPRPEITGNDLRDLIYFIRRSSLQGGSLHPVYPGPDSSDKTPPVISGVAVQRLTQSTARITWTTDKPTLGFVAFASTAYYNAGSALESTYSSSHSVVVTDLPSGTVHYTVVSKDQAGNQSHSNDA